MRTGGTGPLMPWRGAPRPDVLDRSSVYMGAMIRRTPLGRAITALLGAWFLCFATEPVPVHDCPMHSARAALAAGGHGGHGMSTGAMAAAVTAADHGAPAPTSHRDVCTCPGCCAATGAIVLPDVPTLAVSPVTAPASAPLFDGTAVLPSAPDHDHPFANGPPAA